MAKKYIYANELIDYLKGGLICFERKGKCTPELKNAISVFIGILQEYSAADVEEVKHGEWELISEIRRSCEEYDEDIYVECPFCHRTYYVPFEFEKEKMLKYARENYPYCNCGAKMDGGKTK